LTSRIQSVVIDGVASEPVEVKYGVPQGFVLGPKLYFIYANCLRLVAEEYGASIKQYSDDTAIYLEFARGTVSTILTHLRSCQCALATESTSFQTTGSN
jgi:hypothetical protein